MRSPARPLLAVLIIMLFAVPAAPVAADGMPSITLGEEEAERVFGSLFESRQLARVDLVNSTHERITLFLSVYSLDPGDNLTLMVPLRTLPALVTGKPVKESEFRDEQLLDRAEDEVVRQDPDEAWSEMRDETSGALQGAFGSMVMTLPGEYIRENLHLVSSDGEGGRSMDAGGGGYSWGEAEPVQHYEFDGFSVDVFGVDAGPRLADYLLEKGLVLPAKGDLERYNTHYLAVVEGASRPPIDPDDFALLQRWIPNTTASLADDLREQPVRTGSEVESLKYHYLLYEMDSEYDDNYDESNEDYYTIRRSLSDGIEDLIDALFGSTDFAGEALTVELPLDSGKIFFPLGTSVGWPNPVGDIDVLFRVPDGKNLDLTRSRDAYFGGGHIYLFHMSQANPDFDLESAVMSGSESSRKEAARAAFLTDNAGVLGGLLVALLAVLIWFLSAILIKWHWGLKGGTVRDPRMWLMLGAAIVLSVPGAVLAYLLLWPLPTDRLFGRVLPIVPLATMPAALALLVLGVAL
jgi:hypothetical protein